MGTPSDGERPALLEVRFRMVWELVSELVQLVHELAEPRTEQTA
jgi:hypothetical protein